MPIPSEREKPTVKNKSTQGFVGRFLQWMRKKPKGSPRRHIGAQALVSRLEKAMQRINRVCTLGASNKIDDLIRTGGWGMTLELKSRQFLEYEKYGPKGHHPEDNELNASSLDKEKQRFYASYKYGQWFQKTGPKIENSVARANLTTVSFENPLEAPLFRLSQPLINLLLAESLIRRRRVANCGDRARLLAAYLWQYSLGIESIELMLMDSFDHAFVVINRNGSLLDASTWTEGYIVDAWYGESGIVYLASEFHTKIQEIKTYCKQELDKRKRYGHIILTPFDENNTEIRGREFIIHPEIQAYPTYHAYKSTMDYYQLIDDFRFKGGDIEKHEMVSQHKKKFSKVLDSITDLQSLDERLSFFKEKRRHDITVSDDCADLVKLSLA